MYSISFNPHKQIYFRFRLNAFRYFFLVREKTELLNYKLDFVIKSETKMDTCEMSDGLFTDSEQTMDYNRILTQNHFQLNGTKTNADNKETVSNENLVTVNRKRLRKSTGDQSSCSISDIEYENFPFMANYQLCSNKIKGSVSRSTRVFP